jgi:predicted NACHT family NTPase
MCIRDRYSSYREAVRATHQPATPIDQTQNQNSSSVLSPSISDSFASLNWLKDYRDRIQHLCGQIRVLDMTRPVGTEQIYTEVKFVATPRRQKNQTIDELLNHLEEVCKQRQQRIARRPDMALPNDDNRITGLEAIKNYSKLVILGDPGAGKTTFLKFLAIHFLSQTLASDSSGGLIPVFLPLREFAEDPAPSLSHRIIQEFEAVTSEDIAEDVKKLLKQGRMMILLDGIDEVAKARVKDVHRRIQYCIQLYPRNHFVITCRSAAHDYTGFENFTVVEVADFTAEQIDKFAYNWFHARHPNDPEQAKRDAQRFLDKLEGNPASQEMATNPLLLTMLCNLFEASYNLPKNKHTLYGDAVDAWMHRWDATRRIEREETLGEKFSRPRKMNFLSQLAYRAFIQTPPKRFWRESELEDEIKKFIENLPEIQTQQLDHDSKLVLKEVAANHGFLAEIATHIYTFSHLTFQEFFTARYIIDSGKREELLQQIVQEHLTDPAWREVFLVIAGRLNNSDEFLKLIFKYASELLNQPELQAMLQWLDTLTQRCECPYSAYRAFYLAVDFDITCYVSASTKIERVLAHQLATSLRAYSKAQKGDLSPRPLRAGLFSGLLAVQTLAEERSLPPGEDQSLASPISDFTRNNLLGNGIGDLFKEIISIAEELKEAKLLGDLRALQTEQPQEDSPPLLYKAWSQRLLELMQTHFDAGHDIQLPAEATQALENYLYACNLLLDCIEGDSYASRELREKLLDQLLLPRERITVLGDSK